MTDGLSQSAGRLVETLSRRRFLRWLGAGGVALAATLGLDRSKALAQGENCRAQRIEFPLERGQELPAQEMCIKKGLVATTCHLDGTFAAACRMHAAPQCTQANDCQQPQKCEPIFVAADNVVEQCRNLGPDACPQGQILCRCVVRVRGGFERGRLVCGCTCR